MKTLFRALAALVFLAGNVAVVEAGCINPPVFKATMQPRPEQWHKIPKKDAVPFVATFNAASNVSNHRADFVIYGHFGASPQSRTLVGFFSTAVSPRPSG